MCVQTETPVIIRFAGTLQRLATRHTPPAISLSLLSLSLSLRLHTCSERHLLWTRSDQAKKILKPPKNCCGEVRSFGLVLVAVLVVRTTTFSVFLALFGFAACCVVFELPFAVSHNMDVFAHNMSRTLQDFCGFVFCEDSSAQTAIVTRNYKVKIVDWLRLLQTLVRCRHWFAADAP